LAEIPKSHPRRKSLISRKKIVDATKNGLLADSAMIAHGRGEAFDYLLGEKTSDIAKLSIKESAARLKSAKNPVISVNGNTAVLAGESLIRVAAVLRCPIEINIYYRTPERMEKLHEFLKLQQFKVSKEQKPENVNNIYKGSKGYTYIKRPVDPSYWIYQFNKLFEHSDCRWIIVNEEDWKMPDEWKAHKNVFQDTYQGLAKWINNQLTKQ